MNGLLTSTCLLITFITESELIFVITHRGYLHVGEISLVVKQLKPYNTFWIAIVCLVLQFIFDCRVCQGRAALSDLINQSINYTFV